MKQLVDANDKDLMWDLINRLFPIYRCLMNKGVEDSLELIKQYIDITIKKYPSGQEVFDWVIPDAWEVNEGYIEDEDGNRLVDFNVNTLHLAAYSCAFAGIIKGSELKEHIATLPEMPKTIPYRTLYYKKDQWMFCMSQDTLAQIQDGKDYKVVIDVDLAPGDLCIGDYYLPGKSEQEIWITSYICHPSLANDNLSGVVTAVATMQALSRLEERNYSYRLLIWPESIGALTYLANYHHNKTDLVRGGYILTCCGDPGRITYKKTWDGNSAFDLAATHAIRHFGETDDRVRNFWLNGSDEQKLSAPGIRKEFGSFMRTPYSEFPEYHTSEDTLDFIDPDKLFDTLQHVVIALFIMDKNDAFVPNYIGEPFLSKYNVHRQVDLKKPDHHSLAYIQRLLTMEIDGTSTLLDIAERWGYNFMEIYDEFRRLYDVEIFKDKQIKK